MKKLRATESLERAKCKRCAARYYVLFSNAFKSKKNLKAIFAQYYAVLSTRHSCVPVRLTWDALSSAACGQRSSEVCGACGQRSSAVCGGASCSCGCTSHKVLCTCCKTTTHTSRYIIDSPGPVGHFEFHPPTTTHPGKAAKLSSTICHLMH